MVPPLRALVEEAQAGVPAPAEAQVEVRGDEGAVYQRIRIAGTDVGFIRSPAEGNGVAVAAEP